jgi:mannosyltransferase
MRLMSEGVFKEADDVPTLTGRLRTAAWVGLAVAIAAGVVLRFAVHSALWLDEALTVNIAGLPLHAIPHALKQDGAPPLYYYLLHFWMQLFGQSDVAVRALSGLFSVATLPVAWLAATRFGGRVVGWTTVALLASAPFATYYATESRMYGLVIFLSACGLLALQRAVRTPRPGNLIALGLVTALLLYTQYWAIYLVAMVALWLIIDMWWLWRSTRPGPQWKRFLPAIIALAVGVLTFVPWVPTFIYQSRHTGTPWAAPPNFGAVLNAVTGFTFNQGSLSPVATDQGRLLTLIYFIMAFLALFGVARSPRFIELDLHTRPRARGIAFVVIGTLFVAIGGGLLTTSAFSSRYAAVVFLPFLIMVAIGTTTLLSAKGRVIVVTLAVLAGLFIAGQEAATKRTQAPGVAAVINARAQVGDIVAFCPDQVGPSVYRVVEHQSRYDMVTFPREIGPKIVDWVDYAATVHAAHPVTFTTLLANRAGTSHHIWLVWQPGYQTYGTKCEQITALLQENPDLSQRIWITSNGATYYEPMNLTEFSSRPR